MQINKSHKKLYTLPPLPETFWAYFAGFVDGEANIRKVLIRQTSIGPNYGLEMSIGQNRRNGGKEIFNWFQNQLKVGTIRIRKLDFEKPERDMFYFDIKQRMALKVILEKIKPYSKIKTKRIQELLEYMMGTYE